MSVTMLKRHAIAVAIGSSLMFSVSHQALADNSGGSIKGSVATEANAAISGTEITIVNQKTGLKRSITVDADGNYRFPRLPIGKYSIVAKKQGFETVELKDITVSIGGASTVNLNLMPGQMEVISVNGGAISMIDTTSTESALNISALELERIPVARSVNSVALLAPGTAGGGRHGGLSFGGSSAAENAVFINGLNVTDPEVPTSFSSVPFSFYEDFQIKTGGYSAEYGRTTGGVVNAAVKSGSNEFEMGADFYWTPDFLRGSGDSVYNSQGDAIVNRENYKNDSLTASVYASGAIVEDKVFFFAMYEPRLVTSESYDQSGTVKNDYEDTSGFWGAKFDWYITDDHLIEVIGFSDEKDGATDRVVDGVVETTTFTTTGGTNFITSYTGYLTEELTVKAMYGELERQSKANSNTALECNRVMDYTALGPIFDIGCTSLFMTDDRVNKRESIRLDIEYELGDHLLRFGLDDETRITEMNRAYPGEAFTRYQIYDVEAGGSLNEEVLTDQYDFYVRARSRKTIGNFETKTSALYLEDVWTLNDDMTLTLGVRYDEFDTTGYGGTGFMEIDDMVSPRVGFSWDVNGDGDMKLFANAGRYYYPLPNSLVVREGGGTIDISNYYYLEGGAQDADGNFTGGFTSNTISTGQTNLTPNLGPIIGEAIQFGAGADGAAEDQSYRIDNELEASYQDEIIIGMEKMLSDDWMFGARFMFRRFENAVEDMKVYHDWGDCDSPGTWLIGNPGRPLNLTLDCNGTPTQVTLDTGKTQIDADSSKNKTGKDIGSPVPYREYTSLDLVFERAWDDHWSFYGSYTWAESYGNYEGGVNSDTTNDIAGWLEYGDDPMYLKGGEGYLPNDIRHSFKFRGAYALTDELTLSSQFTASSGRPIYIRGMGNPYTTDEHYAMAWECVANCGGDDSAASREYKKLNRGDERLDWLMQLDVRLAYSTQIKGVDSSFAIDVFNLLNTQEVTGVDAYQTQPDSVDVANPDFMVATSLQTQRSVQLSAKFRF